MDIGSRVCLTFLGRGKFDRSISKLFFGEQATKNMDEKYKRNFANNISFHSCKFREIISF